MTREEAIKELERISEDTVQRDCSSCGRITAGSYLGVCCYCSLCQVVPEIFRDYHESKHFRSYWKWDGERKNEALDMAIAALREQPRWIPVEERLPEEDVFYLVWGPTIYTGTKWYDKSNFSRYFWRHDVTHWMPLPEAPKEV